MEERPLGSVGHVSTFGLARLVPGACDLGASRAEQVGRREKPAGVLHRADRTHTLLKAGSHSSVPANCHPEKNTPCGARSFRRNQKCGFSCDI